MTVRSDAHDGATRLDWAFLTSGDSLQLVLYSPRANPPGAPGGWRGWARLRDGDIQWPSLTVDWRGTRAFEPARREVPMGWTVTSAANELTGTLEVRASELHAGEGEGPQLPVDALFDVAGTVVVQDRSFAVRGFLRHEQR